MMRRCRPVDSRGWFWVCPPLILSSSANAQCAPRTCDSIWEVSSRRLSDCPSTAVAPAFEVHRVGSGCWSIASLEELVSGLQLGTQGRVVVYVHGNWMPWSEARKRAMIVYQSLICTTDCEPICFIAFSWPSERSEGFIKDVIGKKPRLDSDAFYLAKLVNQLPREQSLGLIGYSFGGPVICGALHLLNNGVLCGRRLPETELRNEPTRVSLVAPAFDRTALTDCGRFSQALNGVERLVNLYNSHDPILKKFRFFDRQTSPIAAGFAGILEPVADQPLHPNPKIIQYNCRSVGRTHAELDYLQCSAMRLSFENVVGR
jgi:hypothetical protein